jgi:hypothetical protein
MKMPGYDVDEAMIASFQIILNPAFINHPPFNSTKCEQ